MYGINTFLEILIELLNVTALLHITFASLKVKGRGWGCFCMLTEGAENQIKIHNWPKQPVRTSTVSQTYSGCDISQFIILIYTHTHTHTIICD